MEQILSIGILDDHRLFADTLATSLEKTKLFRHIWKFYCIEDLKKKISITKPDVLLMDISVGNENALTFYLKNKEEFYQGIQIIALSSIDNISTIESAIKSGIKGYLSKSCELTEVLEAIKHVMLGEIYLSNEIKNIFINNSLNHNPKLPSLTKREIEVLDYLCAAFTVKEIGVKLEISTHTVQMYVKNLLKKFNINRTTDLVIYAIENKLNNPI